MRLDVTSALKRVGTPMPFSIEAPLDPTLLGEGSYWSAPASLSGDVLALGEAQDVIMLRGKLNAKMVAPCARCLKPVSHAMELAVEETYVKQAREDLPDAFMYEGTSVDLTDLVNTALLLHKPARLLCRNNCPGLCPHCGAVLAKGPCSCSGGEKKASPWSVLEQLLNPDEEV